MSTTSKTPIDFLNAWHESQSALLVARENYRLAFAQAFAASQAKPGDARKAEADAATSELRRLRDAAELKATVAWELYTLVKMGVDHPDQPQAPSAEAA